jgi:hypothetical protein
MMTINEYYHHAELERVEEEDEEQRSKRWSAVRGRTETMGLGLLLLFKDDEGRRLTLALHKASIECLIILSTQPELAVKLSS